MDKLVFRCSKKTLLIYAAIVWMFAGGMVMKLGYEVLLAAQGYKMISVIVAIGVFLIFYFSIFSKMVHKHEKRIKNKEKERLCVFSFFDVKGYVIMACMMTLGVVIRSMSFIPPMYWAPFYVGLGTALFSAGILFVRGWMKWEQ